MSQVSGMRRPRRLLADLRRAYTPRFGPDFTRVMVGTATAVIVGAWVMLGGLVIMVVIGVIVFFASGSFPAVYEAMRDGFSIIILGAVIEGVALVVRSRAIKRMSSKLIAFDPKVTTDGAARLIKFPQLYDRWMSQHPGFVSH